MVCIEYNIKLKYNKIIKENSPETIRDKKGFLIMAKNKFYICKHCGNIIGMVEDKDVPVVCCGEKMQALVPNTVEASNEKHLPVVTVDGSTVKVNVGSVEHPMQDAHFIQWIHLETIKGGQDKVLMPGESPNTSFALTIDDKPIAAYAYCNLHGLWMTEI